MVKFTNEQRLEIIKNYYRNSESVVATLRALIPIFGRNNRPTRQAVRAIVDKFESTYSLLNVPVPVRRRTGRSNENIAAVSAAVQNAPNQSIPRRSQELGISQSTLWRILRKDLGLHPHKNKLAQELKPLDQSIIVRGSGAPNYDPLENNPFQTKSQRKEHEVNLEKIPPELITPNPNEIDGIDVPTLQKKVEAKKGLFFLKPPQIDFKSRNKMKGRGGTVKAAKNKQIVKGMARKEFITDIRKKKKEVIAAAKLEEANDFNSSESIRPTVLDRCKPKKKK